MNVTQLAPRPSAGFNIQSNPAQTSAPTPPHTSLTSKEWIPPPRLKPGRKAAPVADESLGKRKAQNRDAQRAFRERRAAKVGTLEEQMRQQEMEYEEERISYQQQIRRLETALSQCQDLVEEWKARYQRLELDGSSGRTHKTAATSALVPQTPPTETRVQDSGLLLDLNEATEFEDMRCSNCTDDKCPCLEGFTAAEADLSAQSSSSLKRSASPMESNRPSFAQYGGFQGPRALAIDFTAMYAKPSPSASYPTPAHDSESHQSITAPAFQEEKCGFCQSGTHCTCAEGAAILGNAPHQTLSQLTFTPPHSDRGHSPAESPRASAPKPSQPRQQPTDGCENGPGTCAQCRADPRSTLFCKSLAAKHGVHAPSPLSTCCRAGDDMGTGTSTSANAGACCKSNPPPAAKNKKKQAAKPAPPKDDRTKLSCADTFTTLKRHRNFDRAFKDLDSWSERLKPKEQHEEEVVAVGDEADWKEGKHPMEIEAVQVLAVLGIFSQRYGD